MGRNGTPGYRRLSSGRDWQRRDLRQHSRLASIGDDLALAAALIGILADDAALVGRDIGMAARAIGHADVPWLVADDGGARVSVA
jgi:hypothetical protein